MQGNFGGFLVEDEVACPQGFLTYNKMPIFHVLVQQGGTAVQLVFNPFSQLVAQLDLYS